MELIGNSPAACIDPACGTIPRGWLLVNHHNAMCITALASTTNQRGNKEAESPFPNLHPIKGNEKSMSPHEMGLQVANELIFKTCHLPCLSSYCPSHAFSFPFWLWLLSRTEQQLVRCGANTALHQQNVSSEHTRTHTHAGSGPYIPSAHFHQLEVCIQDGWP